MADSIRVFLSYRREDSAHPAGRLGDRLKDRDFVLYRDVDNYAGLDFRAEIKRAVVECDILLAVIGTSWTTVTDREGRRRLDDPDDWVVQEISEALQREIPVVPVLVDGAQMPNKGELPAELADLAYRHARALRRDEFADDADALAAAIERTVRRARASATVRSTGSERSSPPPPGTPTDDPSNDAAYTDALAAFFGERWGEAVDHLTELARRYPEHRTIAERLSVARKQQRLAELDAQAIRATTEQRWDVAVDALQEITGLDRDYRDAETRLDTARTQLRIAELHADIRALHAAGHWAAVLRAGETLAALDPTFTDPDDRIDSARAALAEANLAEQYATGLRQLDEGAWLAAESTFTSINRDRPGYRDTAVLLARARRARQPAPDTTAGFVPDPQVLAVGQWVLALAFSPDGALLATGSRQRVRVWDLRTGATIWTQTVGGWSEDVTSVAFAPDGTRLATGTGDKTARIWGSTPGQPWDASTGQQLTVTHSDWLRSVAYSPDGTRLATGSDDKTARIWDASTGREQLKVAHTKWVRSVAYSPNGTRLATGSDDKTARIWDSTTGQQQLEVTHTGVVNSVAFSPDGTRLATGSDDKTARIWDSTTGQQQLEVTHTDWVRSVAFSPDGTRLATGGNDRTARIWDATTGQQQLQVTHTGAVNAVAFSPDGTRLASASNDKTVRISDAAQS